MKIMNKFLVFGGIVFACLNLTCCHHDPDWDRKFDIINKSDSALYFTLSFNYPDTSLNGFTAPNQWQKILPHDGKREGISALNEFPTVLLFIFDAQKVETTPWDSIIKHYTILKRYKLTKSDLEKTNWTVSYP